MKCLLCPNSASLEEVSVGGVAIRLCDACRTKMGSYIAVVCTNCNTLYWLPKTPNNVAIASEMSGMMVHDIMENGVIHQVGTCKGCYQGLSDYMVSRELH